MRPSVDAIGRHVLAAARLHTDETQLPMPAPGNGTKTAKLSRNPDTSAVIQYAFNRWPALVRYCDDGMVKIDNLVAKRDLRVSPSADATTFS